MTRFDWMPRTAGAANTCPSGGGRSQHNAIRGNHNTIRGELYAIRGEHNTIRGQLEVNHNTIRSKLQPSQTYLRPVVEVQRWDAEALAPGDVARVGAVGADDAACGAS